MCVAFSLVGFVCVLCVCVCVYVCALCVCGRMLCSIVVMRLIYVNVLDILHFHVNVLSIPSDTKLFENISLRVHIQFLRDFAPFWPSPRLLSPCLDFPATNFSEGV